MNTQTIEPSPTSMLTFVQDGKEYHIYELWCWPTVYQKILDGVRTFDIRKDAGYVNGDIVRYRERDRVEVCADCGKPVHPDNALHSDYATHGCRHTIQLQYTGRQLDAYVRCVMHGNRTDAFSEPKRENPIAAGYCVFSIKVSKQSIKHGA